MPKLPLSYYQNRDVVFLAKDLLGKVLVTRIHEELTAGIIVETEAYAGVHDKASHAYQGRRTNRTEVMYQEGGLAYVYLCYGLHYFFNVVTSVQEEPHAVLVRAIEPVTGVEIIEARRNMPVSRIAISSGPGSAAKAMGIDKSLNKESLAGNKVWLEDRGFSFNDDEIVTTTRIGIDYAEEDALRPLRFYLKGNKYVSKPVKSLG